MAPRGAAPTISKEQPGSWIPSTPGGSTLAGEANEEKAITNLDHGWRPWKVVIGCFCLILPTYGLLSSIGLFQTEWEQNQLRGYSKSKISWIISIFGFFDRFFAAPCGILYDQFGPRILLFVGSTIYVASFVGLAFSTTYSQFMACFVVAGISAGMYSSSTKLGVTPFFLIMSANVHPFISCPYHGRIHCRKPVVQGTRRSCHGMCHSRLCDWGHLLLTSLPRALQQI